MGREQQTERQAVLDGSITLLNDLPPIDASVFSDAFVEALPGLLRGVISSIQLHQHASTQMSSLHSCLKNNTATIKNPKQAMTNGQLGTGALRVLMPSRDVLHIFQDALSALQ